MRGPIHTYTPTYEISKRQAGYLPILRDTSIAIFFFLLFLFFSFAQMKRSTCTLAHVYRVGTVLYFSLLGMYLARIMEKMAN